MIQGPFVEIEDIHLAPFLPGSLQRQLRKWEQRFAAKGAGNRVNERGLGIGLVRAFCAITHVPHDLPGASDLVFEALLDGHGKRHEGCLAYHRLGSRNSAHGLGEDKIILLSLAYTIRRTYVYRNGNADPSLTFERATKSAAPPRNRRFRLATVRGCRRELAALYAEARQHRLDWQSAARAASVLQILTRMIEGDSFEARITALEQVAAEQGHGRRATNGRGYYDAHP